MKISPSDIQRAEFRRAFRGFDPGEVAAYLTVLASQVQELLDRNAGLDRRCLELETQLKDYRSVEKALQQTLLQAQETGTRTVDTARREAQLIIQDAELKAAQIVKKAQADLTGVKEQLTVLKAKKDTVIARLRMLLQSELDLMRALEIDEEMRPERLEEPEGEMAKARAEIEDIVRSLEGPKPV
jgi:cell division initiation protein